jgi:thiopeptide-type bacteriocin biosynthesis protein
LPEGRLGNILCRPVLRAYEIPYLANSGVSEDHQIPITDLRVTVLDERIVLLSERLGREVIPRLTSAHDYTNGVLGIYRFLCALQDARGTLGLLGWSWGLLSDAPFLPRVTRGKLVLALARWNLGKQELARLNGATPADLYRAVQALRRTLALPRWISLEDGDNVLPIDLDSCVHVESFAQLVKGRERATLTEVFPDPSRLPLEGPEGRFMHELVVPFSRAEGRTPNEPVTRQPNVARRWLERRFPPGSEWLYTKLYTGTALADWVLKSVVAPVVESALRTGDAVQWFFIRYGDPHWHLRLRLRGDPAALAARVLPALHEAVAPLLRDGRIWKTQLDTYEREVDRYGGDEGLELAEALFQADSEAVVQILALLVPEEAADVRWRLALRGMHMLLLDFGFDLDARTSLLRRTRAAFAAQHNIDVGFEKSLGAKFRAERGAIEALLASPVGTEHPLDPGFAILAERSMKSAATVAELLARERAGHLSSSIGDMAASHLHMHANRLLRAEHRAQELVLYDYLLRSYESEAARQRRRGL